TTPTLTTTATSGLTPTFSSRTTGVCTITSGGSLTFMSAGTCTIGADQAGNDIYLAAPTVTQSFTVNAVVPGVPTVGSATAGDTMASVSFLAPGSNGGAAITGYTITASPGGATGTGASSPVTVTGLTNGVAYTFTVTATNSVGTGPASASSNSIIPKASQTITFANPGAQNFGTTPTLTATATSGLTPTFSSLTSGVCMITSGGALSFISSGTCTIGIDQAGNGSYLTAPTVTQSFTVNPVVPVAPPVGSVSFLAPVSNIIFKPVIDQNGVLLDPATINLTQPSVTLETTSKGGVAYVSIPSSILTSFKGKNDAFIIEIKTKYGSYQVPADLASHIPGLADLLVKNNLKDEDISFKIILTDKSSNKDIQDALVSGLPNGKLMGAVVDFHIDIVNTKTGQTIGTVNKFSKPLNRVIAMPTSITSMPEQWGSFRYNETAKKFEFVPAYKIQINGVWYVKIHSYSNSTYVVVQNTVSFTDTLKHWGNTFIQTATAKGLVEGTGGGMYGPDQSVTRAEFTAMLVRALGRGTGAGTGDLAPFDDVKQGTWYYGEVAVAKELGLLDFANGKNLKPNQPLTREEMASMLEAMVKLERLPVSKENVSLDDFKDAGSIDAVYVEGVRLMVKLHIMTGVGAKTFSPKSETTRTQAAVVLIRSLQTLGMLDD
ncbi:S-layer homology domain-containing protein, partial [Paenibacillus sp. CMAA1364]